ncbi:transposase [Gimesia benthica]|uniref:Transposase n=1 Tax=Gimesia benthica TaxID=2608982 RepID=A0A6I6AKQ3_9PLAN|nr:transposase [Gimesia benthica]
MIEYFNGRLRQECLNQHWFLSLEDVLENWIPSGWVFSAQSRTFEESSKAYYWRKSHTC